MNRFLNNYFSFSKKEGVAAIVLLLVVLPLAFLPMIGAPEKDEEPVMDADSSWNSVSDALKTKSEKGERAGPENNYYGGREYGKNRRDDLQGLEGKLFQFDPNTASPEELKQLGLRDKTISILSNYRNKGGKFRKPDDLRKIYGLKPAEFERLKPYIVIAAPGEEKSFFSNTTKTNSYTVQAKQDWKRKAVVIDINTSDTTAFQSLYGIGSTLAARIVNFREKLGGFYTIDQVGETYGVPDSTFAKIKPYLKVSETDIRKMNINSASYDQLNAHPYISSKLAFLIMKYRKENGNFSTIDPLKDLVAQTNDSYEKVANYLTL